MTFPSRITKQSKVFYETQHRNNYISLHVIKTLSVQDIAETSKLSSQYVVDC
jgi:predicted DNA-binding protein YlxM (UPF0122 family)